ncbi:MAG TPA: hypothetical protein VFV62_08935 [Gaiellaceae bacterium]|nr:hypothetical protein [Gaiellaceae bacterium]
MGFLPPGLRPAWSGSAFLLYSGAFVVLASLSVLFGTLGDLHGSGGLAGWSALFLAILLALTIAARRDNRPVVAGLCGFVALFALAVLVGSLLDILGLADDVAPFDRDLELAPLVVEVVVLMAALYAARELRFPLLLAAAVGAKVVLVLDTVAGVFGTGNWIVWAALLLGFVELALASSLDDDGERRPWAFWKHVAAALLIGGAALSLLDGGDFGWVVIGFVALGYLAVARSTDRSVWAVVGAIGLFLVTTHFVDESQAIFDLVPVPLETDGDGLELWQTALVYTGLGVVYVLLGQLLRQRTLHDVATG